MRVRHAIVTGGSSGIGKASAILLARRGADVTIIARRPELLAAAAAEIEAARRSASQRVAAITADVSDCDQITSVIQRAAPCDLLITSAGIAHPGYFEQTPIDVFERTMAINYFGTLYAIRAVLPVMRQVGGGRIMIVSSGAGLVGLFGYSAYSPSKFALRGLAEALRHELGRDGIKVSICYPPDTDTPQLAMENEIKPAETRAIASASTVWQPDAVAARMLAGLERGQFAVAPGWEMSTLYRWHSLILPVLSYWLDRIASRARPS